MACSTARYPILRHSGVRHYALAATAPAPAPSSASPEIQVTSNRVTVVALDTNNPVAQVSVAFKAGSRNESYDTQGISHILRIAAGLCSTRASYFGITRNIQQLGGNLTANSDREIMAYTLQITRNNLDRALSFLEDVATRPAFKPWEISDQNPRVRYEVSTLPETTKVIELLHKAAYRTGLGYSLYCPKRHVGKIGSETLKHFVNTYHTGPRCAVVATGIPISEIAAFANNLEIPSNEPTCEPSKYFGGELRKERNSTLANVAVAMEGSGLDKEKDALTFALLQKIAGDGPQIKYGSGTSCLSKAVASSAGNEPFAISAFNASYSDSGLFGFVLSAPASVAGSITKAAYKFLKSPTITDADVLRGKNELKSAVLFAADSHKGQLEHLITQALHKGQVSSASGLVSAIDKITTADVQNAARKISGGKVSMASVGDLSTVPYIDQL